MAVLAPIFLVRYLTIKRLNAVIGNIMNRPETTLRSQLMIYLKNKGLLYEPLPFFCQVFALEPFIITDGSWLFPAKLNSQSNELTEGAFLNITRSEFIIEKTSCTLIIHDYQSIPQVNCEVNKDALVSYQEDMEIVRLLDNFLRNKKQSKFRLSLPKSLKGKTEDANNKNAEENKEGLVFKVLRDNQPMSDEQASCTPQDKELIFHIEQESPAQQRNDIIPILHQRISQAFLTDKANIFKVIKTEKKPSKKDEEAKVEKRVELGEKMMKWMNAKKYKNEEVSIIEDIKVSHEEYLQFMKWEEACESSTSKKTVSETIKELKDLWKSHFELNNQYELTTNET